LSHSLGGRSINNLYRRQFAKYPSKSVLVIVSRRDTARSTVWNLRDILGTKVDLLLKPQDLNESKPSQVRVTTAKFLYDSLVSQTDCLNVKSIGLVVCEELDLLDGYYEIGLSLLLHASQTLPTRFVGMSCSINEPIDLASWLRVPPEGCYSFRPTDRDQALSITSQTFTVPPSLTLFKAMGKPLYDTLRSVPVTEACVVFVPTRALCAKCTEDLVRFCGVEMSIRGFLSSDVEPAALEPFLGRLKDSDLVDGLLKGIGMWHEGMDRSDAQVILQLFLEGVVRVLVVPRDAAWTLPARAGLVVVMGTQHIGPSASPKTPPGEPDSASPESVKQRLVTEYTSGASRKPDSASPKSAKERPVMRHTPGPSRKPGSTSSEYTLHELVRMEGRAIRHAQTGRFHIMCQAEHQDTYMRFLRDGLPLESVLVDSPLLTSVFGDLRKKGFISTKQDALDLLGFTFLAKRIEANPGYYDAPVGGRDFSLSRLVDSVFQDTELKTMAAEKGDAAQAVVLG
jgi:antiviral helicase SLH1